MTDPRTWTLAERVQHLYESAPGPWLPVDEQIGHLLENAREALRADVAAVLEIETPDATTGVVAYATPVPGPRSPGDIVPIITSQWQLALRERDVVGTHDLHEQVLGDQHAVMEAGLRWFVNIPVWLDERPFGVLAFVGYHAPRAGGITTEDRQYVRLLGRWVGTLLGQVHVGRERARLEDRFREAQKLEALGGVVGGIAHDFNNLLMTILANAKLVRMDLPDESPVLESVGQLEVAARRAAELTEQMLAYAGRRRIEVSPVRTSRLVSEMASLLTSVVSKNAEIELELDDSVPEIEADRGQLRQVLLNLTTNASDALDGRFGSISIRTGAESFTGSAPDGVFVARTAAPGPYVYMEIEDNGAGIRPGSEDRIFDPFFSTKADGRGLGLAAVLGIVRAHRGAIQLETHADRGTRVRVLLPQSREVSPDASSASIPLVRDQPGVTVLVADDEEQLRMTLERLLVQFDFKVLTAADGLAAVEMVREHVEQLDVVLLDLTMPGLGGEDALTAIREIAPELPILFMSGYHDADGIKIADADPRTGFVTKPFDPLSLIHRLGQMAKLRSA